MTFVERNPVVDGSGGVDGGGGASGTAHSIAAAACAHNTRKCIFIYILVPIIM